MGAFKINKSFLKDFIEVNSCRSCKKLSSYDLGLVFNEPKIYLARSLIHSFAMGKDRFKGYVIIKPVGTTNFKDGYLAKEEDFFSIYGYKEYDTKIKIKQPANKFAGY